MADDLTRLRGAADTGQRQEAARALGRRLGDGRLKPDERGVAVSALIRALQDPSPSVRREAVCSLALVEPATVEALEALRRASRDPDGRVRVRANGALWRAASDKTAAAALRSALKDPAPAVRADAAEALVGSDLASPDDLAALTPMLQDPEPTVPGSAALAIYWICARSGGKAKGAVPALVKAIRHRDPVVRRRSVSALAGIGPDAKSALPEVIRAIQDPDFGTRKGAAWAVGKIGTDDRSVVAAAAAALGDPAAGVRMEAAYTLGRAGPAARPALEALLRATRDPSLEVRVAGRLACWRITGEKVHVGLAMTEALGVEPSRAGDVVFFLAEFGASSVPIILELLSSPTAEIRYVAALGLALIEPPDERAVPPLVRALEDPDPRVRKAAAEALDAIDPKGAKRAAIKPQGVMSRGR
jgi:HEAT repeat protein